MDTEYYEDWSIHELIEHLATWRLFVCVCVCRLV